MKFFAFIFAVFITLLSISSGVVEYGCNDDMLITEKHQDEQEHDECSNCCPFMCCHACCSFTISLKIDLRVDDEVKHIFAKVFSHYKSFKTSEFSSSIWEPPKMA